MNREQETRDVLRWLRARRSSRKAAVRRIGFVVYIVVLFVAIYGSPALLWLARRLQTSHVRGETGLAVIRALPAGLACVFVIVLVGACRNALWRGPVVLSEPDVVWLLPTPLDRTRLLLPRTATAIAVAGVGGAILGALGAILVNAVRPHVGGRLVLGMLGFGIMTAVTAVAASTVVEASTRAATVVRRFWMWGAGLALGLAVLTAARAAGRSWMWANRVVLWSGPWGWAAQLPVAVDRASNAAAPVALGLMLAVSIALVAIALRAISGLSSEALRRRARLDGRVGADLYVGDARSARLEIQHARSTTIRTGVRVRVPRSRSLVITWRDLIAMIRAPGRIAWAAVFTAGATLVVGIGIAVSTNHDPAPAAIAVAVICGYAAAAALLEVARIDNDRPALTAQLPFLFSDIACQHAVVASVVLAVLAVVGAIASALRFGAPIWPGAIAAIGAAPVLVGAALLNTYRRSTPIEWASADPYGFGISFVVLWLLIGPFVALIALVPSAAQVFSALQRGSSPASAIFSFVVTCAAVTGFELWLVVRRSAARARSVR